jgi:sodium/potassium-transporting ATPase subunit alpha
MARLSDGEQKAAHIQFTDVEAVEGRSRPILNRSNSNISIHSVHSRGVSIDPASALPIQYRTVSFQIEESRDKDAVEIQKVKNNAAKGMPSIRRRLTTRTYEC